METILIQVGEFWNNLLKSVGQDFGNEFNSRVEQIDGSEVSNL